MGTKRTRKKRDNVGKVSPWVHEYLKNGKTPKKNDPGYEEYMGWLLFAGTTVPGLPPFREIDTAAKRKEWVKNNKKET